MYRRFRVPAVWQEMDRMQREMDRFLNAYGMGRQGAAGYPAIDLWTNQEGALLTAELPGVKADEIEISVVGETVTLSGSRQPDEVEADARVHRQERSYGKFTRTIQLPFKVEASGVEASFKNGILTVQMPRAEAEKPKKIQVKPAVKEIEG